MSRKRSAGSAADRALHILEQVIESDQPVSVTDLAAAVQLPRPTVSRLAHLLEERGYLLRNVADRKFVPGPRIEKLAGTMVRRKLTGAPQRMILEAAVEKFEEACSMVMLDGERMTFLDSAEAAWPLRVSFDQRTHMPIHCTAPGKLLLAMQRKRVRSRIIRRLRLRPFTERTIVDPTAFEKELDVTRARRVGVDDQEFLFGMVSIAVPIAPPSGVPVAAVSIHAPVFRRSLDDLRSFVPQLQHAAGQLSNLCYLENVTPQAVPSTA